MIDLVLAQTAPRVDFPFEAWRPSWNFPGATTAFQILGWLFAIAALVLLARAAMALLGGGAARRTSSSDRLAEAKMGFLGTLACAIALGAAAFLVFQSVGIGLGVR